jgi:hypothetical protein
MKRSDSIKEIAAALAKAQAQITYAKKDSANPFFKSTYADLASVIDAIKKPFGDNGLTFMQFPVASDKQEVGIETMLAHSSGEWIMGDPFFIPVNKADAQGYGSALTYIKRYSLQAITGVPSADDDGNEAVRRTSGNGKAVIAPTTGAMDRITIDQKTMVNDIAVQVLAHAADDDLRGAYLVIEEANLDADCKVALWSLLTDSKLRAGLKRIAAEESMERV